MTTIRTAPTGRFLGVTSPLGIYGAQTSWVVDPTNGSDADTTKGDASDPLRTARELGERLSYNTIQNPETTIRVTEDLPEDDPLIILASRLAPGASLVTKGTATQLASGTIATVTATAATGNSPWQLVTTGVDWTAIGAHVRVRWTTGARAESVAWAGEVVGAATVRVSTVLGPGTTAGVTPQPGDAFVVERLSTCPSIVLDVLPAKSNASIFTGNAPDIDVRDLDVDGADEKDFSQLTGGRFFGCAVRSGRVTGRDVTYRSCLRDTANGQEFACRDDMFLATVEGGLIVDTKLSGGFPASWTPGGFTAWLNERPWLRTTYVFLNSPVYVDVGARGMHCEEFQAPAFLLFPSSFVQLTGIVTGSSAAAVTAWQITSGTQVAIESGKTPTVLGGAGAVLIAGVLKAYVDIPFYDTANACGMTAFA